MAKKASSQKKQASARRGRRDKFGDAMTALEGVAADKQQFGGLNKDGTVTIDLDKLDELKAKLGKAAWSRVRFVALNAPFKRRSPIPPA